MNAQAQTDTVFRRSSALFNSAGRLISWDRGFEVEFAALDQLIQPGATYSGIFGAILSGNLPFRSFQGDILDTETAGRELEGFGSARTFLYRNPSGQLVRVEETISVSREIFRVAEDVTEEWSRKEELAETKQHLSATHGTTAVVPFKFAVTPDGRMELPPPSAALKRLFGLD